MGETIAKLGMPTLFVIEGGYAVAEIGINAVLALAVQADGRLLAGGAFTALGGGGTGVPGRLSPAQPSRPPPSESSRT